MTDQTGTAISELVAEYKKALKRASWRLVGTIVVAVAAVITCLAALHPAWALCAVGVVLLWVLGDGLLGIAASGVGVTQALVARELIRQSEIEQAATASKARRERFGAVVAAAATKGAARRATQARHDQPTRRPPTMVKDVHVDPES